MRRHRGDFGQIFNHPPVAVLAHPPQARLALQLGVEAFFDAFDTLIVDIGKADQVGRDVTGGIKAPGLFSEIDTGQVQLINPRGLLGIDLAGQVEEAAVGMLANARLQIAQRQVQRLGQRPPARVEPHAAL